MTSCSVGFARFERPQDVRDVVVRNEYKYSPVGDIPVFKVGGERHRPATAFVAFAMFENLGFANGGHGE